MHREAQLVYAARGTMQVTTPKGRWLVPPDRAVWVPARLEHSIDVLADIEMRTLYFDLAWLAREAHAARAWMRNSWCGFRRCCIRRSWRCSMAATTPTAPGFWCGWPCSNCISAEDSATFIPLPHEPRCRRAADIVLGDPTGAHEIETLAREVGTSARTLSRLFASETQLSFKSWCQRARIAAAIERLSMDAEVSVKQLASDLGYASVPAFSHAFRQVTGKTPTAFSETK